MSKHLDLDDLIDNIKTKYPNHDFEVNDNDPPMDEPERDADEAHASDPLDIFGVLTPEPVLTADMLPPSIRVFAADEAERLGVTLATIAMPCIGVCASAMDARIRIQPKRHNTGYTEIPILDMMGIAPSGSRKSDALKKAAAPLVDIDATWAEEFEEADKAYQQKLSLHKKLYAKWENDFAKHLTTEAAPEEPIAPPNRQVIAQEATIEAIGRILVDNPRGIVIMHDELALLFGSFDAYKSGGGKINHDRPLYLSLYDGGRQRIDRASYKRVVPNWVGCILGSIQDEKLRRIAPSLIGDGLGERFIQYRIAKAGIEQDRMPDEFAGRRYHALVNSLTNLDGTTTPRVTLSEGAHSYRERIEEMTRALNEYPAVSSGLRSHAGKLAGMWSRVLLVMHAIDHYEAIGDAFAHPDFSVVTEETAKRCYDLFKNFVIPSSVLIYSEFYSGTLDDETGDDAKWIAGHILAHSLGKISLRDIGRAAHRHDMAKDERRVKAAMAYLVNAGWATVTTVNRRDSFTWSINPRIHELNALRADQERRDREEKVTKAKLAREVYRKTYA